MPTPLFETLESRAYLAIASVAPGAASAEPKISSDARYVAFIGSTADQPGGAGHLLRRDLKLKRTEVVSGIAPNSFSDFKIDKYYMTPNGRFFLVETLTQWLPADTNAKKDWYWRDMQTGALKLVSAGGNNRAAGVDGASHAAAISDDGRFVAWSDINANKFVSITDNNRLEDLLLRDMTTNKVRVITTSSKSKSKTSSGGVSFIQLHDEPIKMTPDGKKVFYAHSGGDLTAGDTNAIAEDVYVYDAAKGSNTLITSVNGKTANGNVSEFFISADAKYIALSSSASNLVPLSELGGLLFMREISTKKTNTILKNYDGSRVLNSGQITDMSRDGRYVTFFSPEPKLSKLKTDTGLKFVASLYRYDRVKKKIEVVSVNAAGKRFFVNDAKMSANGRFVAFTTSTKGVVKGQPSIIVGDQLFVRDMVRGTTRMISVGPGNQAANFKVYDDYVVAAGGTRLVFRTSANNLLATDDGSNLFISTM